MITTEEIKAKTPKRFWKKIKFGEENECWEWQKGCFDTGYAAHGVTVSKWNYKLVTAHRYLYTQLHGKLPNKLVLVCHSCDNRKCCNPNHFFIGTHKDNSRDMYSKGRQSRNRIHGAKHPSAKLTESDIPLIRELIHKQVSLAAIRKFYGVSWCAIDAVRKGVTWKHVS